MKNPSTVVIKNATLLLLLFLFFVQPAKAHTPNATEDKFSKMTFEFLPTLQVEQPTTALPFSDIEIIDRRADTSTIGFYESTLGRFYKLNYTAGLSTSLEQYIRQQYSFINTPNAPQLFAVLKKFRATTSYDNASETAKEPALIPAVIAVIEFYERSGAGYKAISREEVMIPTERFTLKHINQSLKLVIDSCVVTAARKYRKMNSGRKTITLQQIESYNETAFTHKILNETTLHKGVYMTFDDFKNNSPAFTDYQFRAGSLEDLIYVKQGNGTEYPERNTWGYCDGYTVFINLSDNYIPLMRVGNTYNIFGAKELTRRRNVKLGNVMLLGVLGGGLGSQNKKVTYTLIPKAYQLDMHTGDIY
jgi:hypothetical protein